MFIYNKYNKYLANFQIYLIAYFPKFGLLNIE